MEQVLKVDINNEETKSYNIEISDTSLLELMRNINKFTDGKKRLFVVSKTVYKLYKESLSLNEDEIIILKDGEKQKNYKNCLKIIQRANELNLSRKDFLIAIGGGVIGDITAFSASIYKRGINCIQVPTTLLSMIDSSVGGKTAINFDNTKNVIGTFWQPCKVYINLNFIKTLDKKQYISGLGEMIKYAFIEDSCGYTSPLYLFEYLSLSFDKVLNRDIVTLSRLVEYCLNLKIAVVKQDEKEQGLRKILNFGHTIAHALEAKTRYRKFTHGEAVLYGIAFLFHWAYLKNYITYSYYKLAMDLFEKYDLKSKVKLSKYCSPKEFLEIIQKDKKTNGEDISFIIPYEKKKVKEILLSCVDVIKMF